MYLHGGRCIYVSMYKCTCGIYRTLWDRIDFLGIHRSFLLRCFAGICVPPEAGSMELEPRTSVNKKSGKYLGHGPLPEGGFTFHSCPGQRFAEGDVKTMI